MSNLIGQSLGRYHILEQLGEGGMATVYKAFDTRLERHVAVKVILPQRRFSEKFLKRFEREAKALAKLSHPNIVKVLDFGEHEGLPYLVMEYLPGGTLKEKLTSQPMPWQEAARLILPIASALEYAHQQKIVHRDIKPSNILLTQSGEPMLSDFGVAKILETEETIDLTGSGVGIGTPEYMAPEQGMGHTIDPRADIYALGVVLYEMVTGRKPYRADTPMAVMLKKATEPLPRPRQFVPSLPDFIEGLLIKALARNPENRYTDMRAFALALEGGGYAGRATASKLESGKRGYLHAKYIGIAAGTLALCGVLTISVVGLVKYLPNLFAKQSPEATPGSPGQAVVTETEPINLPTSSLPTTEPVFSPSTTPEVTSTWQQGKLIYIQKVPEGHAIYLLDLKNGGDPQLILSPDSSLGTYQGPVLSQDGTRIALYVYKKYTLTTDATPYSSSRILADCTEPSWSWDGSQILCRALDGFLEIVDAQTGQLIEQFSLYGVIPAWSPGGGEAVYASSGNDSSTVICRFDFDSQTTVVLAGDKFENYAPSWSPDGEWIAYQSAETGGMSQIWIMDRDGRDGRQITDAGNWSRGPAWSPDGQWLAFVSEANGSIGADYGEVFVVSLNSGESYQVTHTGGNVYDWRVSWSK